MRPSKVVAAAMAALTIHSASSKCDVERSANASSMHIQGGSIVDFAKREKGQDYSWGGGGANGPSYGIEHGSRIFGFDCSGLVQYAVYQASNGAVRLPRTSQEQAKVGKAVSRSDMRPGDIIAFDKHDGRGFSHIGIYIGNNKMIHAPQTGDVVKVSSLDGRENQRWAIRRVV